MVSVRIGRAAACSHPAAGRATSTPVTVLQAQDKPATRALIAQGRAPAETMRGGVFRQSSQWSEPSPRPISGVPQASQTVPVINPVSRQHDPQSACVLVDKSAALQALIG